MLKEYVEKITNFFNCHYFLLLIILVLISFGQIIFMQPWEDDQALFFKLAHINEPAGFFGPGPFGSGIYRFGATAFIPVYNLFGFNTFAYFGFLIVLYIITTIIVYKTFTLILGNKGGKISGFLYACGYITSEGFIRMANSATTSISIIFCSIVLSSYWKFSKSKSGKYWWYAAALFFYYLAVQITLVRVHYFLAVIILFEFIFIISKKSIKSYLNSAIRLLPFTYIFIGNYIIGGDSRTGEIGNFLLNLLHGQFYQLYGFLSSLSLLVIPDWSMSYIFNSLKSVNLIILIMFTFGMILVLSWNHSKRKFLVPPYLLISSVWIFYSNNIFNTPLLRVNEEQIFVVSLGGIILILSSLVFLILKKYRKIYTFLFLWLIGNLFAYSAYFPTVVYDSVNRYLAHSFLALVGILAIFYLTLPKDKLLGKIGAAAIILLGIGNVYNAAVYQNNILHTRSYPSKQFYNQLKSYLPVLVKGDVLYINVSSETENLFTANITAAMMPNTTSFAWRYGIDRYDFKLTNDFNELMNIISSDKIPLEKIHSFVYSKKGVVDTTEDIRNFLTNNLKGDSLGIDAAQVSDIVLNKLPNETGFIQPDLKLNLKKPIKSTIPSQLLLSITATPPITGSIFFPLVNHGSSVNTNMGIWNDSSLRSKAFDYKKYLQDFCKTAIFEISSDWKERIGKNINDQDLTTIWQSDRILWKDKKALIKIDLSKIEEIDRLAWVNGFPNNTPTSYTIEVSRDRETWTEVKKINSLRRIQTKEMQTETFPSAIARFVRVTILDTIDGDSPSIAELWVIPSRFKDLEVGEVGKFLENPFAYIPTDTVFEDTLTSMQAIGKVKLYWEVNDSDSWQTSKEAEQDIIYDGQPHKYNFSIKTGGTSIDKIKLSNFSIPGKITINSVEVIYPKLEEYFDDQPKN